MKQAGQVVQAAMDNWRATGQHPGSDPDVRNGLIKAFAPVLLQRAMAMEDDGTVRNIATGMPTAKGLSVYDQWMYRIGLQPLSLEKQLVAGEFIYHDKQDKTSLTRAYGDALAEAFTAKNGRAADNVIERYIAAGGDVSGLLKSAMTRMHGQDKTSAERMAKPVELGKFDAMLR
jgi:hypothetical protein